MKYTLSGSEIIQLIAKYAEKEHPELLKLNGKSGSVSLNSKNGKFWAELEVGEKAPQG